MSNPLLHSPADILRRLLIDIGGGTSPETEPLAAWPVYSDLEPDGSGAPDEVITTYDTDGYDDGQSMIDGELYQHHGVQVRFRAKDHPTGWLKAAAVRRLMAESVRLADVTMPDNTVYLVYAVTRIGRVIRVGRELGKTRRHLFTVNAAAAIKIVPAIPANPHTILTVNDDDEGDGVAQATTAVAHGLTPDQPVTITGCSVSAYNGSFLAGLQADNPLTQFWLLDPNTQLPVPLAGVGTGGTWS